MNSILKAVERLGYVVFRGNYNLNIIGVRSSDKTVDVFNDRLHVVCDSPHGPVHLSWPCTTEPGKNGLLNPQNSKGVACVVPGQYRGTHKIDLHAGRYKALCQRNGKIKVYRDNNRDLIMDMDPATIDEGFFGINIHAAVNDPWLTGVSAVRQLVGPWSEGCWVLPVPKDFRTFIQICEEQPKHGFGDSYSITLINDTDVR